MSRAAAPARNRDWNGMKKSTLRAQAAAVSLILGIAAVSCDEGLIGRSPDADNVQGSLRLDTSSLETRRVYSRINDIPRGKNYNIILYFFESFPAKYLDLRVNGKEVVPNWRRLAQNAFVARNHYANFPLTANAFLSVFTSAYDPVFKEPFEPGAEVRNSETLKLVVKNYPDIPLMTMSEILKRRGYRTLYFHTWTLGYVGMRGFLQKRKFDSLFEMYQLGPVSQFNGKVGYGIDDRAMIEPGIGEIKKDLSGPFFAVFCPLSPHFPYEVPDAACDIAGPPQKNATFEEDCKRKYINSLHYSDAVLGMLIDRLEAEGLLENTLVFIFSDHGQAFLEHKGNFRHRTGIYEENVHVPLLLYSKRFFRRPVTFDGITRHIDILPTVQDILGIEALPEQEGVSMLSRRREQMALLQTYAPDHIMGVRDRKWKYLYNFTRAVPELYDLSVDPEEKNNLSGQFPDVARRYQAVVERSYRHRIGYYKKIMKTDLEL